MFAFKKTAKLASLFGKVSHIGKSGYELPPLHLKAAFTVKAAPPSITQRVKDVQQPTWCTLNGKRIWNDHVQPDWRDFLPAERRHTLSVKLSSTRDGQLGPDLEDDRPVRLLGQKVEDDLQRMVLLIQRGDISLSSMDDYFLPDLEGPQRRSHSLSVEIDLQLMLFLIHRVNAHINPSSSIHPSLLPDMEVDVELMLVLIQRVNAEINPSSSIHLSLLPDMKDDRLVRLLGQKVEDDLQRMVLLIQRGKRIWNDRVQPDWRDFLPAERRHTLSVKLSSTRDGQLGPDSCCDWKLQRFLRGDDEISLSSMGDSEPSDYDSDSGIDVSESGLDYIDV